MIPPSGSGRSAPLPAPGRIAAEIFPESVRFSPPTVEARCGAERPHREGGIIPPLLGAAAI